MKWNLFQVNIFFFKAINDFEMKSDHILFFFSSNKRRDEHKKYFAILLSSLFLLPRSPLPFARFYFEAKRPFITAVPAMFVFYSLSAIKARVCSFLFLRPRTEVKKICSSRGEETDEPGSSSKKNKGTFQTL